MIRLAFTMAWLTFVWVVLTVVRGLMWVIAPRHRDELLKAWPPWSARYGEDE